MITSIYTLLFVFLTEHSFSFDLSTQPFTLAELGYRSSELCLKAIRFYLYILPRD